MGERIFDDLARALAEPMPRRSALRLIAGAFVGVALGSARTSDARAGPTCEEAGLISCNETCCVPSINPVCCEAAVRGRVPPGQPVCCGAGQRCCSGPETPFTCCLPGQTCNPEGRCILRPGCPRGGVRCGSRCCRRGQRCVRGVCRGCEEGRTACGKTCCRKGEFCCSSDGPCCDKAGESCCNVGKPGDPVRWTCCPKGTSCAPQLELSPTGRTAGVPKDAPRICCPQERVVPLARNVCCPPGHVSLGGDAILPPGGGGGLCCRKDKLCGSGKDRDCCSSGSPAVPEFETTCCGGRCVNTRFDREHCGGCGRACASGERCDNGTCVVG